MTRLLLCDDNTERWRGLASRLRGVTIDACIEVSRCLEEACHAVAFVGKERVEKGIIERCLRAGKHVLFAGEPSLRWIDWESL